MFTNFENKGSQFKTKTMTDFLRELNQFLHNFVMIESLCEVTPVK